MRINRSLRLATIGLAGAAVLGMAAIACGGNDDNGGGTTPGGPTGQSPATGSTGGGSGTLANLTGSILIDGSSTVHPLTEAVAEEFDAIARNVEPTVGISGTGGGFSRFCNGETDISNASRPIRTGADSEASRCQANGIEFIEIPIAYDGLSVVIHPSNDWATCLTMEQLKTIWSPESEGQVMRWNQVNPAWPNEPLVLFGAGTDSGTFDYFTEAVNGRSGDVRTDFTPSEDDNVLVQGVAGSPGALGFFGLAYLEENRNRIKGVEINSGNGCVEATAKTVESGEYSPLSRPLFIYVNAEAAERPEVEAFVDFYLDNVRDLSADVGYVPFPASFYDAIQRKWESRETGSIFSGARGTVGDILGAH